MIPSLPCLVSVASRMSNGSKFFTFLTHISSMYGEKDSAIIADAFLLYAGINPHLRSFLDCDRAALIEEHKKVLAKNKSFNDCTHIVKSYQMGCDICLTCQYSSIFKNARYREESIVLAYIIFHGIALKLNKKKPFVSLSELHGVDSEGFPTLRCVNVHEVLYGLHLDTVILGGINSFSEDVLNSKVRKILSSNFVSTGANEISDKEFSSLCDCISRIRKYATVSREEFEQALTVVNATYKYSPDESLKSIIKKSDEVAAMDEAVTPMVEHILKRHKVDRKDALVSESVIDNNENKVVEPIVTNDVISDEVPKLNETVLDEVSDDIKITVTENPVTPLLDSGISDDRNNVVESLSPNVQEVSFEEVVMDMGILSSVPFIDIANDNIVEEPVVTNNVVSDEVIEKIVEEVPCADKLFSSDEEIVSVSELVGDALEDSLSGSEISDDAVVSNENIAVFDDEQIVSDENETDPISIPVVDEVVAGYEVIGESVGVLDDEPSVLSDDSLLFDFLESEPVSCVVSHPSNLQSVSLLANDFMNIICHVDSSGKQYEFLAALKGCDLIATEYVSFNGIEGILFCMKKRFFLISATQFLGMLDMVFNTMDFVKLCMNKSAVINYLVKNGLSYKNLHSLYTMHIAVNGSREVSLTDIFGSFVDGNPLKYYMLKYVGVYNKLFAAIQSAEKNAKSYRDLSCIDDALGYSHDLLDVVGVPYPSNMVMGYYNYKFEFLPTDRIKRGDGFSLFKVSFASREFFDGKDTAEVIFWKAIIRLVNNNVFARYGIKIISVENLSMYIAVPSSYIGAVFDLLILSVKSAYRSVYDRVPIYSIDVL